jgi:hypothetical protein
LPRSPAFFGIKEGATTQQPWPFLVRERESQEPQGPASETKTSGLLLDCSCRMRLSIAHCRVPTVPRETTSAPYAWAIEATAMDAVWTSMPT